MSTAVIGLFDSHDTAELAEGALLNAGFAHAEIKLQSYDAGVVNGDDFTQGLSHGQSLVAVTTDNNVGEDKALHILRENGAIKINEITDRYHGCGEVHDAEYVRITSAN